MGYSCRNQSLVDGRMTHNDQVRRPPVRGARSDRLACFLPKDTPVADGGAKMPGQYIWAAEIGGHLVGTIGLIPCGEHVARIQWFRMEPDWQHTAVLTKLLCKLYEHCDEQSYRHVILDGRIAPRWIWRSLVRLGFRLVRRIRTPQSELLEFVLEPRARSVCDPGS